MNPPTDEQLLARSGRDPEAFGNLVDRHSGALHRYVARRLGPEDAEDLVSEVFVTAHRMRDRFDPGRGAVRPWLFGIATNLVHRHRRAEARRLEALARLAGRAAADPDEPEPRTAAERAALAAALRRMRTEHRDALFLHAVAGLTIDEIGAAMGAPAGTVKAWLHRARAVGAEHLTHTTTEGTR
ncbi:MAG: RNA polymerase sigma factor [Thermoleophilia bacterium]|nr:RNA polymerase sigma factor [Thermoleophilia bacterium]